MSGASEQAGTKVRAVQNAQGKRCQKRKRCQEPFFPRGNGVRNRFSQEPFFSLNPFNVFSEEKFRQKLDFMHTNPVTRGLVSSPCGWPGSSWRFYYLQDASILRMDRLR